MKRLIILCFFLAGSVLLGLGIAEVTGFSLVISLGISVFASILVFLMLDLRPSQSPKDTIYRLTRGSWYRKKK
ncbi:hypothetical protein SCOR_17475 [Sulfidibacter corallicola]|uniref:Uncharacterized protein n=1 Tax=Sulfidibacter corallicola TaxID=2818388 RepID=A0A8A4TXB4_SULCO|nr:hypothetical protein [Sulfidibacter corallicola]QTD53754.1 hypothetical protein J3U87_14980 [Sulfidibacter corallicola]